MATYATYRHVELDKIGQGKKRVLKPPGGGSSISFMDEPITTKSSGESSPQAYTPKPSFVDHDETSLLPKDESSASTPVTVAKNGMDHQEKIHSSVISSYLKENIPPPPSMSGKGYESVLNVSLSDCDLNKESPSGSDTPSPLHNSDCKSDTKLNEFSNVKSVNGVNGVNGTHEKASNVVNGNNLHEKIDSSDLPSPKVSSPQNGSYSPANLSALSSLVTSPSMKPNQDTKERVIGDQTNGSFTPKSSQQPRKIKDHMRSSIIMSDEDYTPTRTSRFNATINDTPPENLPSAGQRQRIPPGGFSSKLW
ncbi:Microtubule-associated protein Jupiter [Armadillidium nasatum]|uniref:Microtubule-associated protein Jupiter n=1 Tax=Armadillidium nasatum TaxID=96803 RepID=A0A5N5TMJ4_9CRUS|nr:Microtubule-associated protein Jupiter [Armadillidium nasatum]